MNEEIRRKILTLLDQHRIMTIATLRPLAALSELASRGRRYESLPRA
jgi:hypothetical protein